MKKILVASPVRGGVSVNYVRCLISLYLSRLNKLGGGPNAPYSLEWATTSGTSVAMARDHLADLALKGKFDALLFWDVDLGAKDPGVMLSMFDRLLSHDVDIVAGQYVGRNFLSHFHGAMKEGASPDERGLMEMMQVPIGFSLIKTAVFERIREKFPERRYALKETVNPEAQTDMFEFFPNGVVGPCSAEGKLERIRAIVKPKNSAVSFELIDQIAEIIYEANYESNIMLGEDYYFCKLARESGSKLYIDNNLIVPHETSVRLPVKNQDIIRSLTEEWRLENGATPDQVAPLLKQLTPLFSQDIP